jgi:hypothetical protein
MTSYSYVALDARGQETRGALSVENQVEAVRRLNEMGFLPTKVTPERKAPAARGAKASARKAGTGGLLKRSFPIPGLSGRVKRRAALTFTRQVATLLEAGIPLMRGLRLIQEHDCEPGLKRVISEIVTAMESGSSLNEAMAMHPRAFNGPYVQIVKAGEISGALDVVLARLATFMDKAQRLKNRVSTTFTPSNSYSGGSAEFGVHPPGCHCRGNPPKRGHRTRPDGQNENCFAPHRHTSITNGTTTSNRVELTFSNPSDGLIRTNIHWRTDYTLRLPPLAPETGYSNKLELFLNETRDPQSDIIHAQANWSEDDNYYFRVRTTLDSAGTIQSALYGKIYRGIRYHPRPSDPMAAVSLHYYLNPDGTRNLESRGERPDNEDDP